MDIMNFILLNLTEDTNNGEVIVNDTIASLDLQLEVKDDNIAPGIHDTGDYSNQSNDGKNEDGDIERGELIGGDTSISFIAGNTSKNPIENAINTDEQDMEGKKIDLPNAAFP
jgi:hypothetical protein